MPRRSFSLVSHMMVVKQLPGASEHKMRSKTAHRIARCDWKWAKFASPPPTLREEDADSGPGESGPPYDPAWEPMKAIVEALLRRAKKRISLEEVSETGW